MNIDSPQYPSAGVKSTLFKIDDQTSKTIDYTQRLIKNNGSSRGQIQRDNLLGTSKKGRVYSNDTKNNIYA